MYMHKASSELMFPEGAIGLAESLPYLNLPDHTFQRSQRDIAQVRKHDTLSGLC